MEGLAPQTCPQHPSSRLPPRPGCPAPLRAKLPLSQAGLQCPSPLLPSAPAHGSQCVPYCPPAPQGRELLTNRSDAGGAEWRRPRWVCSCSCCFLLSRGTQAPGRPCPGVTLPATSLCSPFVSSWVEGGPPILIRPPLLGTSRWQRPQRAWAASSTLLSSAHPLPSKGRQLAGRAHPAPARRVQEWHQPGQHGSG